MALGQHLGRYLADLCYQYGNHAVAADDSNDLPRPSTNDGSIRRSIMPKSKRTNEKPQTLDMKLEKGIDRFTGGLPGEIGRTAESSPVPLIEDDTGHRLLVYATGDGMRAELRYEGDTFWATQAQMAAMFGVDRNTVSEHLVNIYRLGELVESATSRKIREVRLEGSRQVTREVPVYDLNAMISVGYRVGSKQGTMFRIWATNKLFQILTKGFYIDEERLKNRGEPDVLDEPCV